jgi:hypothetical protein
MDDHAAARTDSVDPGLPTYREPIVYRISRREWRRIAMREFFSALIFAGVAYVNSSAGIAYAVPWIVIGVLSIGGDLRRGALRRLTIDSSRATYREASRFAIETSWSNADALVRWNARPDSLALLLREPARADLLQRPLTEAMRSTPYPADRVIPLRPFVDDFVGSDLERRLRVIVPALFESPPAELARDRPTTRQRALGIVVLGLPLIVSVGLLIAGWLTHSLPADLARASGFAAILSAILTPVLLLRHRGSTGERLFDYTGRVLLHPRLGESRRGVLVPMIFLFVTTALFSAIPGPRSGSSPIATTATACTPAAFPASRALDPEPAWPGDPFGTQSAQFGAAWASVPVTENGVSTFVRNETQEFQTTFIAYVRRQVRAGLVQIESRGWKGGGITAAYVYEIICLPVPVVSSLTSLTPGAVASAAIDPRHDVTTIGSSSVLRESYSETNAEGTTHFDNYEWVDRGGNVWRVLSRTDGPDDAKEEIEAAIATIH